MKNIVIFILAVCCFSFLAGYAYGADCTYTNVVKYDTQGQIVGANQEYVCKTPPPKIMTQIDPFRTPVEIIYPNSYYNGVEEREKQQLENLYTVFSILSKLGL